jgi:hypothetical protein
MAVTTGDNNFNTTKWIVNKTAGLGTHTTIASALTSASSGDDIYIMPGTYTESPGLKAGVNLIAYNTDGYSGTVIIKGTCTAGFNGTANITGCQLQTNTINVLSLTGANATVVNLINCYINCTNQTGISSTGSNSVATISLYNCTGNLGTTGIAYFSVTNGTLALYQCVFNNSGNSTTANTFSGLSLTYKKCYIGNGTTTSGSTAVFLSDTNYYATSATNATAITSNSTVASQSTISLNDYFSTGSATPIVVGASSTIFVTNATTYSSSATLVSGAGTFTYGGLVQSQTVGTLSATTLVSCGTIGNQTSTAPAAGYIGEVIQAANTSGTTITPTATVINISSITLTPGIWDISGNLYFNPTGANIYTFLEAFIATTSNGSTPADNFGASVGMLLSALAVSVTTSTLTTTLKIGPGRLSVSVNTTYYLNAYMNATTLNMSGAGVIRAVRVA